MHRQNRLTAIKKHPDVSALAWLKCSALLNKPLFKFIAIHVLNLTEILLVVKLLPPVRRYTATENWVYPPANAARTTPELMSGFTRINSVHEGDGDGAKVLYYVNVPAFHVDNRISAPALK